MINEELWRKWFPARVHYAYSLLDTQPATTKDFIEKFLPSKIWRLNNLYTIINKYGDIVPFRMNNAQFYVYSRSLIHPRLIILKSRQQGISTLWLISFIDDVIFMPTISCGLMAQDKDAAAGLLERVKFIWEHLDSDVKLFLKRSLDKDNSEEFKFNNKSSIQIKTSFRSATLQRLHISELGKVANKYPEKAKETKTGSLQTIAPGNTVVIESTAEGDNLYKKMWDTAVKQKDSLAAKDFYPVFLSWIDDPDCIEMAEQPFGSEAIEYFARVESLTGRELTKEQKNFWVAQERELEGDIYQEYPATPEEAFAAAKDGTYWAKRYTQLIILRGRKRRGLYDPSLPVYAIYDLGRNDYTAVIYIQYYRKEIRIVGEYHNSGEDIEHYAEELKEREKLGWTIADVALPHDADAVVLGAKGKSRREQFVDAGIFNIRVLKKESLTVGIDEVRHSICDMYIDEVCSYIENCFLNYTKEWNPVLNIWRNEPKKSIYCHGADTIRYAVQYCREYLMYSPIIDRHDKTPDELPRIRVSKIDL